jgi:hypothetical protein
MLMFAQVVQDAHDAFGWDKILAALVGAIATGSFALVLWWLNRKRPGKIQVQEIEIDSLLRIADTVRPRIAATFDGQAVAGLSQTEFAITSDSADTINNIVITFQFHAGTRVLECELSGLGATKEIIEPNTLRIVIPFLNSYRHHGDCLTAKIVCDGSVEKYTLTGRGEGWSVVHKTASGLVRFRLIVTNVVLLSLCLLILAYMGCLKFYFEFGHDEVSWRVFFACLPVLIIGVVPFVLVRWMVAAVRRVRR